MKKIVWEKAWARKYSVFTTAIFMKVYRNPQSKAFFGWSKNKLMIPEGNLYSFYFEQNEFKAIEKKYLDFLFRQNIRQYTKIFEKACRNYLSQINLICKHNFAQLSNNELAERFKEASDLIAQNAEWQFLVWFVVYGLEPELKKMLVSNPNSESILSAISTPEKLTQINKSHIEFLKLLSSGKVSNAALAAYANKYAWLPVYECADAPWSKKDFAKQIIPSAEAAAEIKKTVSVRIKNLTLYKKFINSIKDRKLKKTAEIVHAFAYIKELRDDYRRPAYYKLRPMWSEIAKRIGATYEQANNLTTNEILIILSGKSKFSRVETNKRIKNYAVALLNNKLKVYSDKQALKISKNIKQEKGVQQLSGIVAYAGKITGKAKIIYHQGEFSKFKKGEILVTAMTHPEFLPLIRKSKAIITDEGGMACHAAIVAREFKIPTITGTKKATTAFKDGDIIEVDAIKGTVKKI